MPYKITTEEVLAILAGGGSREEQAQAAGIGLRQWYKRVASLKAAGKLNASGALPGAVPSEGFQIARASKQIGQDGQLKGVHVTEVPLKDDEDYIDPETAGGRRARLSTYRGSGGEIIGQWDIKVFDRDTEAHTDFLDALLQKVEPDPPVGKLPHLHRVEDLALNVVLSDTHIGSLSWEPETGGDWDLKIAEDTLVRTFQVMLDNSPPASHLVLSVLGDWLHYDLPDPMTTLSGNILSSDGRQEKMIDVAIRVLKRIIAYALQFFDKITLLIAEGNHDLVSSIWMRRVFDAVYADEPRITVVDSPFPFYALLVGDVFLGYHHGHMKGLGGKPNPRKAFKSAEELVAIFADEFAPLWGMATKRYIHTGHYHTKIETEPRGAQVIQHPTIQSRDDYAARHGWASLRNALGICYHSAFGETARNTISPEMILGADKETTNE